MNKYIIRISNDFNIIGLLNTFDYLDDDIELSREEYEKALKYEKFNPTNREFYNLRPEVLTDLEEWKNKRIVESKHLLEKWLESNPLFSTVHNLNGEYYTVTQEKQTQLTQMITLASLAAQTSQSFTPTWNSTSNICEEWTINELTGLTFQITQYVLPRVKKQQSYEVQIRECQTIEEVEAIEIEYETI